MSFLTHSFRRPGYALATILILMGVVLFAAGATISVSVLESRISLSQQEGVRAYYVAEAGVEDALWRLNHIASYSTDLQADTLNITYSASNVPQTGEGFTVTLTNTKNAAYPSGQAGYGSIDVVSYSTNNGFTAHRHVTTTVYQGPPTVSLGNDAILVGGDLNINNGNSTVTISGNVYAGSSLSVNHSTVNLGSGLLETPGSYTNIGGTVTSGGIESQNNPPAPTAQPVPGFPFSSYASTPTCTSYFPDAASFQSYLLTVTVNHVATVPGPVTCLGQGLTFGSWLNQGVGISTIAITGMLVVNGAVDCAGNVGSFTLDINDPGNGKSGLFASGKIHNIKGSWNINGVLYSGAGIQLNNSPSMVIDGALIAVGGTGNSGTTINTSSPISITYNASRVNSLPFSGSTPAVVQQEHWEDQY